MRGRTCRRFSDVESGTMPEKPSATIETRALDLLYRIFVGSSWYTSAIELDQHGEARLDGEELKVEVEDLLIDAGRLQLAEPGD